MGEKNEFIKVINDKTIEEVKNIFGILFPYAGIRKKNLDCYIKEVENSNMKPETKAFYILNAKTLFKYLQNQDSIIDIAIQNIKKDTSFDLQTNIDEEWFDRYMESAKFVSDKEMQTIWGKILAGEFEEPGTIPSSMIRVLSETRSKYAKLFSIICSFKRSTIVMDEADNIIYYDDYISCPFFVQNEYYDKLGINFETLTELDTLGLIVFDHTSSFQEINIPNGRLFINICGVLKEVREKTTSLPIGSIILTDAGKSLCKIIDSKSNDEHIKLDEKYMNEQGFHYLISTEYKLINIDGDIKLIKNE